MYFDHEDINVNWFKFPDISMLGVPSKNNNLNLTSIMK